MKLSNITEKVLDIVSQVMELPREAISESSSSDTLENWDSMTQMALTLALEEEFKIKIPSSQASKLANVKLIISTIENLTNASS